jgi:hypothetical protein
MFKVIRPTSYAALSLLPVTLCSTTYWPIFYKLVLLLSSYVIILDDNDCIDSLYT